MRRTGWTASLRQQDTRRVAGLVTLLGGSSIIHAVRPQAFEPLVPPVLGSARAWVYASGVVEFTCAALLAAPATRRWGGWRARLCWWACSPQTCIPSRRSAPAGGSGSRPSPGCRCRYPWCRPR